MKTFEFRKKIPRLLYVTNPLPINGLGGRVNKLMMNNKVKIAEAV
jgi:hypothetical protein